MKTALFLILCICSGLAFSQYEEYLGRRDLYSVLLEDEVVFEVNSIESSSYSRKYKALILDKKADDLRDIVLFYDQFREVASFQAKVSNISGEELETFGVKDMQDIGVASGMASDNRVKYLRLPGYEFPFVVEVDIQVNYLGSMFYPEWMPQAEEGMKVVHASFSVIDKSQNGVRFYPVGLDMPKPIHDGMASSYTFILENLDPYFLESWNYHYGDYTPYVTSAPVKFKMDDYVGEMNTWNEYGRWIQQLNAYRSSLVGLDLSELDKSITDGMSDFEKITQVYNYLQTNTRYVSIQLGIGGWQPFPASYVHQKKYGDCKALSNYTVSLLKRYGIRSLYTLIRAGKHTGDVPQSFPNAHFNHAIVTVPLEDDTLFLECTSQISPMGYQGTSTSDRNALIITEEGGKMIRTRKYLPEDNLQKSQYKVVFGDVNARELRIAMERKSEGIEIETDWLYSRYYENEKDNYNWFIDNSDFGSIQLDSFKLLEMKEGPVPTTGFKAEFVKPNAIRKAGNRLLLEPSGFFNSNLEKVTSDSATKPIRIRYGYSQHDSLEIELPKGYYPNPTLKSVNFNSKFGSYSYQISNAEGKLYIVRDFIFNDGIYPPVEFAEFKAFVNRVISSDRKRIVLVNRT